MTEQRSDYDSPWKEIIEDFFPSFLEFFFPEAYAVIDWEREQPYEFLDSELQQLEPDAEIGKRLVDKVAKVWLKNGEEAWIIVHVEIQGYYDKDFAERMYIYNYRLFDRHRKRVISLAVLADEGINWRPNRYESSLAGCCASLQFPIVKLLDYEGQWDTLEQTTNPFGMVVMAHLRTKGTNLNPESRLHWKLSLVKMLFKKGYSRKEVKGLFRFIDWVMFLPEDLAISFKTELKNDKEVSKKMRYVTSIERLAKQEGKQEKAREDVVQILQIRFGEVPEQIASLINTMNNLPMLERFLASAITINSLEEFEQLLDENMGT